MSEKRRVDPHVGEDDSSSSFSRRSFLKTSAAGAGALVLPAAASSSAAADEKSEDDGYAALEVECTENWFEPWEWHVWEHKEEFLQLNVVEHANTQHVTGDKPETLSPEAARQWPDALFSYNGLAPGPTIRMGGDDALKIHLVNRLSGNNGNYAASNPATDRARFVKTTAVPRKRNQPRELFKANDPIPFETPDWLLSDAELYGQHLQHTTNLHTHGLHVSPWPNADGSHSDNVMLRIIPKDDYHNRLANEPPLPLRPQEIVGDVEYEFRLGSSFGPHVETHPPGTHWYHPHPHGATSDQVASGMVGFLVVEGDVDAALESQIENYKERLIMVQRIVGPQPYEAEGVVHPQIDPHTKKPWKPPNKKSAFPTVNGRAINKANLRIVMRPGAIERWRVLNGSTDGMGYMSFAVVKGDPPKISPFPKKPNTKNKAALEEYQHQLAKYYQQLDARTDYLENPKHQLWLDQLAFDGVTLVDPQGNYNTLRVQSLAMSPANRADFLFQAPDKPGTYTIWGIWDADASDQGTRPVPFLVDAPGPVHLEIATVCVQGKPFDPGVGRVSDQNPAARRLQLDLPEVPSQLKPVTVEEMTVSAEEAKLRGHPDHAGKLRTRRIIYGGWGAASYPNYDRDDAKKGKATNNCNAQHPCNSMTIDGSKFRHETIHKMALGKAEEWTVDNFSMTIYAKSAKDLKRGEFTYGQALPFKKLHKALANGLIMLSKAVDHPFHMHQSPFQVTSVKDTAGNELLPKDENGVVWPRWQDTVRLVRNGGRSVFRSRFPNFPGEFVNHCHLLNHEDAGMMQMVGVVINPFDANYEVRAPGDPYPKASLAEMFKHNLIIQTPAQPGMPPELFQYTDKPYPPGPS